MMLSSSRRLRLRRASLCLRCVRHRLALLLPARWTMQSVCHSVPGQCARATRPRCCPFSGAHGLSEPRRPAELVFSRGELSHTVASCVTAGRVRTSSTGEHQQHLHVRDRWYDPPLVPPERCAWRPRRARRVLSVCVLGRLVAAVMADKVEQADVVKLITVRSPSRQ
jgi:hypothetical protein